MRTFTKSQIALIHKVHNKPFATSQIDMSNYREVQAMRKLVKEGILLITGEKHGYNVKRSSGEVSWQSDVRVVFA